MAGTAAGTGGSDRPGTVSPRWAARAGLAVLRHPSLWTTSLRQVRLLAPTGWWKHWPFVPLPDPDYLRFRMQTAYGDSEREPDPSDLVTYLHWCRAWPRLTR